MEPRARTARTCHEAQPAGCRGGVGRRRRGNTSWCCGGRHREGKTEGFAALTEPDDLQCSIMIELPEAGYQDLVADAEYMKQIEDVSRIDAIRIDGDGHWRT